ncbi:MAG: acyl-ACP--UDP-N-acetylglucosamine O-acyltransferase [Kiritimatiellae bacterium]|nr:acyl-ACP--UDP-N-acetylglucosamine O-acyltransferase [Kiritimatiellia bacterium]MDD5522154.1 acyl-ACP--UDP-N-acetylglucosamine O-acyltransferase [Kiritimatiellia bacterium]
MIHKTAIIEPGAEIGKDVTVGPFSYIEGGAKVGDECVIGPHVSVMRYTTLGTGCRVHAGAVLGDLPQDLSFKECESYVKIGSNCVVREGVTVHRGTKPGTTTEIGDSCFLMANSHFAHNVKLGNNVIVANGALMGGYVEVGDRAFISANVGIHQFVHVGRLVMVGGNSGLSKDLPPFCIVRSLTFNLVAGMNVIGMRRAGITPEERAQIKRAFKMFYCSGLNVKQALEKMKSDFTSGPAQEFWQFVEQSKRGVCAMKNMEKEVEEA